MVFGGGGGYDGVGGGLVAGGGGGGADGLPGGAFGFAEFGAGAGYCSIMSVKLLFGRIENEPVTGPSSSAFVEPLGFQPRASSSAIMRPEVPSFRLRFLAFFSGFESAVR